MDERTRASSTRSARERDGVGRPWVDLALVVVAGAVATALLFAWEAPSLESATPGAASVVTVNASGRAWLDGRDVTADVRDALVFDAAVGSTHAQIPIDEGEFPRAAVARAIVAARFEGVPALDLILEAPPPTKEHAP